MTIDNKLSLAGHEGAVALRCVLIVCLLSAFPALHVALMNPGQVSLRGLAFVLAGSCAAALLLMALLRLVRCKWSTATVVLSGLAIITFSYGPLHSWLNLRATSVATDMQTEPHYLERLLHENMLAFWALAVCAWLLLVGRLGGARCARIAQALPVVVAVLYLSMAAQGAVSAARQSDHRLSGLTQEGLVISTSSAIGYEPDIYYIVLDGYARADVLNKYYSDDNGRFLDALRSRGFTVTDNSSANYYWTFLSLASSLNFQYLDALIGDPTEAQLRGRGPFFRAIRDNEAARFLRQRGYRYLHFQSTWGGTLENEFADQQISCANSAFRDDYVRAVVELTPLKMLEPEMAMDLASCYRSHFTRLADLGSVRGPKFVFAHFLPPHHPYLFDSHGRTLRHATISDQFEFQKKLWEERDLYVGQLTYVNTRILEAVDSIVASSARPPVILIQSDHGPNLQRGLSLPEQRRIRFANLSAALLPGAPRGLMPDEDSAVNKLPRIFNFYFGADIPIRPDRHYYSAYDTPFELEAVALDTSPAKAESVRLARDL